MFTERLERIIETIKDLPPDDQDRLAAVMERLKQPSIKSDVVRPEVMAAFEEVIKSSTAELDYLRDK